jgi:hypothetical protein
MDISTFVTKLEGLCTKGVITTPERNLVVTSLGMLSLVMAQRAGEREKAKAATAKLEES